MYSTLSDVEYEPEPQNNYSNIYNDINLIQYPTITKIMNGGISSNGKANRKLRKSCSLNNCHKKPGECMHCTCDGKCGQHLNGKCGVRREGSGKNCKVNGCSRDEKCFHSTRATCCHCRNLVSSQSRKKQNKYTQIVQDSGDSHKLNNISQPFVASPELPYALSLFTHANLVAKSFIRSGKSNDMMNNSACILPTSTPTNTFPTFMEALQENIQKESKLNNEHLETDSPATRDSMNEISQKYKSNDEMLTNNNSIFGGLGFNDNDLRQYAHNNQNNISQHSRSMSCSIPSSVPSSLLLHGNSDTFSAVDTPPRRRKTMEETLDEILEIDNSYNNFPNHHANRQGNLKRDRTMLGVSSDFKRFQSVDTRDTNLVTNKNSSTKSHFLPDRSKQFFNMMTDHDSNTEVFTYPPELQDREQNSKNMTMPGFFTKSPTATFTNNEINNITPRHNTAKKFSTLICESNRGSNQCYNVLQNDEHEKRIVKVDMLQSTNSMNTTNNSSLSEEEDDNCRIKYNNNDIFQNLADIPAYYNRKYYCNLIIILDNGTDSTQYNVHKYPVLFHSTFLHEKYMENLSVKNKNTKEIVVIKLSYFPGGFRSLEMCLMEIYCKDAVIIDQTNRNILDIYVAANYLQSDLKSFSDSLKTVENESQSKKGKVKLASDCSNLKKPIKNKDKNHEPILEGNKSRIISLNNTSSSQTSASISEVGIISNTNLSIHDKRCKYHKKYSHNNHLYQLQRKCEKYLNEIIQSGTKCDLIKLITDIYQKIITDVSMERTLEGTNMRYKSAPAASVDTINDSQSYVSRVTFGLMDILLTTLANQYPFDIELMIFVQSLPCELFVKLSFKILSKSPAFIRCDDDIAKLCAQAHVAQVFQSSFHNKQQKAIALIRVFQDMMKMNSDALETAELVMKVAGQLNPALNININDNNNNFISKNDTEDNIKEGEHNKMNDQEVNVNASRIIAQALTQALTVV